MLTNKTVQIAAYADDINIMSRRIAAAKEIFLDLKNKAKEVGLAINIDKIKILIQTRRDQVYNNIEIEEDTIEVVDNFTYLGVKDVYKRQVYTKCNIA